MRSRYHGVMATGCACPARFWQARRDMMHTPMPSNESARLDAVARGATLAAQLAANPERLRKVSQRDLEAAAVLLACGIARLGPAYKWRRFGFDTAASAINGEINRRLLQSIEARAAPQA